MFLKKHRGEEIPVKTEEELAVEKMKALESTLDFLRDTPKPVKQEPSTNEVVEPIDSQNEVKLSPKEEEETKLLSEKDLSEEDKKEIADKIEAFKEKEIFKDQSASSEGEESSIKHAVEEKIKANKIEESIDRNQYPAYKKIPDDIKRAGRFGRLPRQVQMIDLKAKESTLDSNVSELITDEIDKQTQEVQEVTEENIKVETENDIKGNVSEEEMKPVNAEPEEANVLENADSENRDSENKEPSKKEETDSSVEPKIQEQKSVEETSKETTEKTEVKHLKNPLPTPKKHVRKEIDFDHEVLYKDLHFDIVDLGENDDFDIKD